MDLNSRVERIDFRNISETFCGMNNVLLAYFCVLVRYRLPTNLFVCSCTLGFKPVHRLRE
jgi:hypothetical protein